MNKLIRGESTTQIVNKINILEQMNVIEIIDDNGYSDMTCRFIRPFFRDSLYQSLLYGDQRSLHALAAEFIQNSTTQIDVISFLLFLQCTLKDDPEKECMRMVIHTQIAEDVKGFNYLSKKAKKLITIKRITNLLLQNQKVIKSGDLFKQGNKDFQKVIR
jgi:hypothetical protein